MGRRSCPYCGKEYYINPYVDVEYACPNCGRVESERMVGQKSGRGSDVADE